MIAVCDHFEPFHGVEKAEALARVAMEVPCFISGEFITRMLARAEEETPGAVR